MISHLRSIISIALIPCICLGQAVPVTPELPRSVPPSTQPAVTGTIHNVVSTGVPSTDGSTLQSTYNSASCGDQIKVQAGATYTWNYIFNKQCNAGNWIQVVSANLASIPITTYATQAQANNQGSAPTPPNTANFAKLTSGNGASVFVTTDASNVPAKYNYFAGLEVTNNIGLGLLLMTTNSTLETSLSQMGDHIIFDRMYIHGIKGSSSQFFTHGMTLAGSNVAVVNSYLEDFYSVFADAQAIFFTLGPGPYLVHNNFLEGAGENTIAGGNDPLPGTHCTVASSPAPTTTSATVTGCTFINGGASAPSPTVGTGVMFVTSASAPQYTPDNWVTITSNSGGALTFAPMFGSPTPVPLAGTNNILWGPVMGDFTITNNVYYKAPNWNPASTSYDGVSGNTCTVASPTTTSATIGTCVDANGNPVTLAGLGIAAGSQVIFYVSGSTILTTLSTVNTSTGAVTFPALSGTPTSGVRQCLLGPFRDVKNLFETKSGFRWFFNGNIMQHTWNGGQQFAVNFASADQDGGFPWALVQDMTFTNNILQDIGGGFQIITAEGVGDLAPGPLARLLIANNLFWSQTLGRTFELAGYEILSGSPPVGTRNGADSVQIIHNTMLGAGTNLILTPAPDVAQNFTNLVIRDNITEFDQFRWAIDCQSIPITDGTACVTSMLNTSNTAMISNNAIINSGAINGGGGVSDATLTTRYGFYVLHTYYDTTASSNYSGAPFLNYSAVNTDYHNYALTGSGGWIGAASDGKNPGVDFAALDAALAGTVTITLTGRPGGGKSVKGKEIP